MIKAIETVYNGYRFRSRLEARWAVFFDSVGIKYLYEPEGFEIDSPDGLLRYLPDFYFPNLGVFGEVKGGKCSITDKRKIFWSVEYQGPCKDGIILLGSIPPDALYTLDLLFQMVFWHKGVLLDRVYIDLFDGKEKVEYHDVWRGPYLPDPEELPDCFDLVRDACISPSIEFRESSKQMFRGFGNARMARFEHGEKPILW